MSKQIYRLAISFAFLESVKKSGVRHKWSFWSFWSFWDGHLNAEIP